MFEEFRQVGTAGEEGGRDRAGSRLVPEVHRAARREDLGAEPARRGLDVYVHDPGAWCALIMQNPCASMPGATSNFQIVLLRNCWSRRRQQCGSSSAGSA